jgi:hypothetical protein
VRNFAPVVPNHASAGPFGLQIRLIQPSAQSYADGRRNFEHTPERGLRKVTGTPDAPHSETH